MSLWQRAARVWLHRERVEREAALLFDELGRDLAALGYRELAARAHVAAEDERRHAVRCRAIVDELSPGTPPAAAPRRLALGPASLSMRDRALYAGVAIGCVTESLSCALLLELRATAERPIVVETIEEIVRDEVEHSRIGWALLAGESAARDVAWLAPHVEAMSMAAVRDDVTPMAGDSELGAFGVLPRARVSSLVEETWTAVIGPGLRRFGVARA